MGSLSVICLLIASAWAYFGAHWVLAFAVIDVLALAAAVVWCVRHATDYEKVLLTESTLIIERCTCNQVEQWSMKRFYVRVNQIEVPTGPFKSIRLKVSAQQESVVLGGFCHIAALKQCEKQLKLALKS
jgi:uncharacterized membrane protein